MCVRKNGIYILPPTRETRTTMTTERHRSNGDRGRADGRLRSSNSRNETPKQFRVIGKSGRCFRAIPWLVTAYHRVARQPTALPTRGLVSSYRGFQGGFARFSVSLRFSLPLSLTRSLHHRRPLRHPPPTSRFPQPLALLAISYPPSAATAVVATGPPLEFLEPRNDR